MPSDIQDDEIKLLANTLPYIITKGRAKSTTGKYEIGWKGWVEWAKNKNEVISRPAEPFYVATYLNHLLFINGTKGGLTTAFYGIRWAHHTVGLDSPTDNPLVQLAYEGCLRSIPGTRRKKEALPIDLLKKLVDYYTGNGTNLYNLRFLLVCLLGFCGFFRIEELLSVQLKHISIERDHLSIFVEKSKCDQHREGEKVYISRTGSKYCPVNFTETFLKEAGLSCVHNKESFLIPTLHKSKKGYRASKSKGISDTRIREFFKEKIKAIDDRTNYGMHSLRSGGASAAAQNGVPDRLISKQGRWASDNARNGYIQDSKATRLRVTKALGL